jgi:hypothetical protein
MTEILPCTPEQITPEWLSSKLGMKHATVKVNRVIAGTATKVLITFTFEVDDDGTMSEEKPMDLCIKGGLDPAMLAAYPFILSILTREVDFYNLVAHRLGPNMTLPRTLWAGKTASNALVVMEDLASAGFEFGDPVHPWTVTRVLSVVEQLAILHAATWGTTSSRADDDASPWLSPSHYEASVLGLCGMWDAMVLAADRPACVPTYMKDQRRMTAAVEAWFATRNPRFRCILHGDAHLGNVAWSEERQTPVLFDWQIVHVGSCFADVAYFVVTALTAEDRRRHEMDLLDHYLAKLHQHGGPKLSRDDAEVMSEYRKSVMAGFSWVLCPYTMQSKECVLAIVSRVVPALEDHQTIDLLQQPVFA